MCPRIPQCRRRSFAGRIVLWVAVATGTAGCLYSPAEPGERRTGVDNIGVADGPASLRLGTATRAQVVAQLGSPKLTGVGGRAVGYEYDPITGHRGYVALGGPCGLCGNYPWDVRTHETLWLAFNSEDVLCRAVSSRDAHPPDWAAFCAEVAATNTPSATRPGT